MTNSQLHQRQHITVAGNIGVGKSTLVRILAEEFDWQPYYEVADDHPYLSDYYIDPNTWGFHSQIWFLAQRYAQHQAIATERVSVCQDRSIYEDYEVFVKGLHEQGIFSDRDLQTYQKLFTALIQGIKPPTLMIYLHASTSSLLKRINKRARTFENEISTSYLESLEHRYAEWLCHFKACPVLSVETDDLDFSRSLTARREVVSLVRRYVSDL